MKDLNFLDMQLYMDHTGVRMKVQMNDDQDDYSVDFHLNDFLESLIKDHESGVYVVYKTFLARVFSVPNLEELYHQLKTTLPALIAVLVSSRK